MKAKIENEMNKWDQTIEETPGRLLLHAQIIKAYQNKTRTDLTEILNDHLDEHSLCDALKDFLAKQWLHIKGTCLSYTATPRSNVTQTMCMIAESLYAGEQNNLPSPLSILMPGVNIVSTSNNYPTLGSIKKTQLNDKKKSTPSERKKYTAEQKFIEQGVYKEQGDRLILNLPLIQILETHIENEFGDALIAVTEYIGALEEDQPWCYSSAKHNEIKLELTELIKDDGLISKAKKELAAVPLPNEELLQQKEKDLSNLLDRANQLSQLLKKIKQNELYRLSVHGVETIKLREKKNQLMDLKFNNIHLLSLLQSLYTNIKYFFAPDGHRTLSDRIYIIQTALTEFKKYFSKLNAQEKAKIPSVYLELINTIIRDTTIQNSKTSAELTNNIEGVGSQITTLIDQNEIDLTTITLKKQWIAPLTRHAEAIWKTQTKLLKQSIASTSYKGADELPIKKTLLEAYNINLDITTANLLSAFFSLNSNDLSELVQIESIKTQLINHPLMKQVPSIFVEYLSIFPVNQLMPVITALGGAMFESYMASIEQNERAIHATRLCLHITEKEKQALIRPFLIPYNPLLEYSSEKALNTDATFMLSVLPQNIVTIVSAAPELIYNTQFMLEAIKIDIRALQFAPNTLKDNEAFMLEAIKQDIRALQFAPDTLKDRFTFMLEAIKQDIRALQFAPDTLKNNFFFMSNAIAIDIKAINFASATLKNTAAFMMIAAKINKNALDLASNDLLSDGEFMLEALKIDQEAIKLISGNLNNDRSFMVDAAKISLWALQFASAELRDDKEIVLIAMNRYGRLIDYASNRLKADQEVILAAMRTYKDAFLVAADSLKKDETFVLAAVKQNGSILNYVHAELKQNREIVLAAVQNNGIGILDPLVDAEYQYDLALQYAPTAFRNDIEIVLTAVNTNCFALKFASEELKNRREIVLAAIQNNGLAFKYASRKLTNDAELAQIAVKKNRKAILYASSELKSNSAFIFPILKRINSSEKKSAPAKISRKEFDALNTYVEKMLNIVITAKETTLANPLLQEPEKNSMTEFCYRFVDSIISLRYQSISNPTEIKNHIDRFFSRPSRSLLYSLIPRNSSLCEPINEIYAALGFNKPFQMADSASVNNVEHNNTPNDAVKHKDESNEASNGHSFRPF